MKIVSNESVFTKGYRTMSSRWQRAAYFTRDYREMSSSQNWRLRYRIIAGDATVERLLSRSLDTELKSPLGQIYDYPSISS